MSTTDERTPVVDLNEELALTVGDDGAKLPAADVSAKASVKSAVPAVSFSAGGDGDGDKTDGGPMPGV
ncbi:hypothetical protein F0L68_07655 [Solihabitans fulvus]|uniref:Uncharacterized protein n=1 Tax=Solihabitans fulvus TaxID=1892852 RepID=A0A5B2XK88_9PSEU|nr:hypothetical protein [Solihabitans fulvus]KAA2264288.1 hypothetical protein F0L68_07655 [Solihabitans fulvus]